MIKKISLGEVVEFQRGYDLTHDNMDGGEYPVEGSTGTIGYHSECKARDGIVLGRSGTVGKPRLIKGEFWPHNTSLFTIDIKGNDLNYLYYCLVNLDIEKMKSGSNIPTLNRNFLYPLELLFENELNMQKKVAAVLVSLDEKIENNNVINAELESIAKTLYDYWFLQFEFPNEDGKPYKSSGGKMVWNEELKREIPEGWETKKISNLSDLYQPQTISEKELIENGKYSVYGANGIVGKYDKYNHEQNEIAVCCRGASCGEYLMTLPKAWITGNAMVIHPKKEFNYKEYIYYSLSQNKIQPFITGSAQPQITRTNLENMIQIVAKENIIKEFELFAIQIRNKIQNLMQENQELASLRNFLLPLLMNGQVGFKEEE